MTGRTQERGGGRKGRKFPHNLIGRACLLLSDRSGWSDTEPLGFRLDERGPRRQLHGVLDRDRSRPSGRSSRDAARPPRSICLCRDCFRAPPRLVTLPVRAGHRGQRAARRN